MSVQALSTPVQPASDPDSRGFWEATAAGELAICRCVACRTWLQPPLERCRHCAAATRFERVSGRGTIFSFIVVRHPCSPGYLDDLPYLVGLIELEEQENLKLVSNVVDIPPDDVKVGMAVQVTFREVAPGYTLPLFTPVASTGA